MKQLPKGSSAGRNGRGFLFGVIVCAVFAGALFFFRGSVHEDVRQALPEPSFNAAELVLKSKAALANFEGPGAADTGGMYPPGFERDGLEAGKRDRSTVLAEVVRDLNAAAEAQPDSAEAHHLLGTAYFLLGDAEKGAAAYGRALEHDPTNINSHIGHIVLLSENSRHSEAEAAMKRFETLFPVELETMLTLRCTVNLYAGKYRRSGAAASDLLVINPDDAWARQVLALSLDGLGYTEKADGEWARIVDAAPEKGAEARALRKEWAARRKNGGTVR